MDKNEGILGKMIKELGEETALEQFKIKFKNTYTNSLTGHWAHYKYPAFGNILHWLYVLGSFMLAETATISDGNVKLHGKQVATYEMNDELQRPVFKFDKKYDWLQKTQDLFAEGFKRPELSNPIIKKMKDIYGIQ